MIAVRDVGGGLLLVPQFTLAADTRKGARPGFSSPGSVGPEIPVKFHAHPSVGRRLKIGRAHV